MIDDSESISISHPVYQSGGSSVSRIERAGMWIETSMTHFFTEWGVTCARYPIPVIILSLGFAAGLCTGIQWLKVETDPVELWAAPESRSRVEKTYFDEVFRPFYRTQQVIVHAKNLENVRCSLSFNLHLYGFCFFPITSSRHYGAHLYEIIETEFILAPGV